MKEKFLKCFKVIDSAIDCVEDNIFNIINLSFIFTLFSSFCSLAELLYGREEAIAVSRAMYILAFKVFLFLIALSLVVSTIKVIIESKRKKGEGKQ